MRLLKKCPPYMLKRVMLVILLEDLRGLDMLNRFLGVVTFRVSLPFDKVLQFLLSAIMLMVSNSLDFILFLIVDKVRRWS